VGKVRRVARAIGWLFVALLAIHVVRAATQAERAASGGHWGHAIELAAIGLVAFVIVAAAIVNAVRSRKRVR
jgi:hypothetical protein